MHKISNLQSMETLINVQYATGKQQSAYVLSQRLKYHYFFTEVLTISSAWSCNDATNLVTALDLLSF